MWRAIRGDGARSRLASGLLGVADCARALPYRWSAYTRLAADLHGVPVSVVSMLAADRQFLKGPTGLTIDMGFSLVGLLTATAILAPNLLLLVFPPRDGISRITNAGLLFTVLERIGQCLLIGAPAPGRR